MCPNFISLLTADVRVMRQKALDKPFPIDHSIVLVEVLERSNQLLVAGVPSGLQNVEKVINAYFGRFGLPVVNQERRSEGTYVVTFKDCTGKFIPV